MTTSVSWDVDLIQRGDFQRGRVNGKGRGQGLQIVEMAPTKGERSAAKGRQRSRMRRPPRPKRGRQAYPPGETGGNVVLLAADCGRARRGGGWQQRSSEGCERGGGGGIWLMVRGPGFLLPSFRLPMHTQTFWLMLSVHRHMAHGQGPRFLAAFCSYMLWNEISRYAYCQIYVAGPANKVAGATRPHPRAGWITPRSNLLIQAHALWPHKASVS